MVAASAAGFAGIEAADAGVSCDGGWHWRDARAGARTAAGREGWERRNPRFSPDFLGTCVGDGGSRHGGYEVALGTRD